MEDPIILFLAIGTMIAVAIFFKGRPILPALTVGFLVSGLLVGGVSYLLSIGMTEYPDKPELVNYEYRKTENSYGVQFFRFQSTHKPPVNPNDPLSYVREALEQVVLPSVHGKPDAIGRANLTWQNYGSGRLIVYFDKCETNQGHCIHSISVDPGQRERESNIAANRLNQRFVSRDGYEHAWPFTVDYGRLTCHGSGEVFFRSPDGTRYALNGLARASDPSGPDIRDIWEHRDSAPPGWNPDLSQLIPDGFKLCNSSP